MPSAFMCAEALRKPIQKALVVLAQQSIDLEELNASDLLQEIKNLEEDVADAGTDEQRGKAQFALDRLIELQTALDL